MRTTLVCLSLLGALFAASSAQAQEGNARALRIARQSPTATAAVQRLHEAAATIGDPALRAAVLDLLDNPAPTFLARFPDASARARVVAQLTAEGLAANDLSPDALFPPLADPRKAAQPLLAAPAQATGGHHSYPGGLAEHTAFNLRAALDLAANYRALYRLDPLALQKDFLVAAPILHDLLKAYVLQWHADGTLTTQAKIGGTVSHHIFGIAEALHRKLPPQLVVASAHDAPFGEGAAKVVTYLRAASLLAGVNPVALGLLVRRGAGFALAHDPPIEAAIHHLSDHDFVLAEPIEPIVEAALDRLLPKAAEPRWTRYRALAALGAVRAYQVLTTQGDEGLRRELRRLGVEEQAPR